MHSTPSQADVDALARALKAGVIVVAGTPNEAGESVQYPAAMNGVVSVNAFDSQGNLLVNEETGITNVQPEVTVVAPGAQLSSVNWEPPQTMSGSSFATPMVAGILAAARQKYPDATANQLIQSLIHNTRPDDHPLERDTTGGSGYGPVSLRHILRVDPMQYPDVNPLMDKEFGEPTVEQIGSGDAESPTPEPTASTAPSADRADAAEQIADSSAGWILAGAGVLVAAGIVAVVLVVRSRRKTAARGD